VSGPRRLHPAGIAVLAVGALRGAAFPGLIAFVATVGGGLDLTALARGAAFAVLGIGLSALAGYVTWRTVSYTISDGAVVARRGVLAKRETVVPLDRIQAVDTVQGPLQRLFGVTAVHLQAAGGGREGEIVLEALGPEAVAELRAVVARSAGAAPGAGEAPAPAPDAVRTLDRRGLALAAVTSGQLGVILPVLAGATQLLDDVAGGDPVGLAERLGITGARPSAAGIAAAGAALLLLAWALSIAGAVVAFAGFRVTRDGDRLLIRRGLLARREASVPLARVQAVTLVEGLLRQPFGLGTLRVEVAGYATEAAAAQTLFPLVRSRDADRLVAELVPALAGETGRLSPAPGRALRPHVARPVLLAAPFVSRARSC
jgi:putative membrane protein